MGEGQLARPSRSLTKVLLSVVACAAIADLLLFGLGFLDGGSFRDWAVGALLALAAALAWELVEQGARGGRLRSSAWVAFPLAFFLAFASLPFLAMSVYPPLKEKLTSSGRVEARILETTGTLEIFFPRPVMHEGINLKIGSMEITSQSVKAKPEAFQWKSPRTLSVDWRRLLPEAPQTTPGQVGINMVLDSVRFRYETEEPVPPQQVRVR